MGTEDDDEIALTRHLGHTLGAALRRAGCDRRGGDRAASPIWYAPWTIRRSGRCS